MGVLVREKLDVFLHWCSAVKDRRFHFGQILAESRVLILDLIRKFTGMAHNENCSFSGDRLDLLQGCKDEDSCFSEARLGLT